MNYIKGTTSLTQEVNISKAMKEAAPSSAGTYIKLAGYTRGWDGTNVAVMLPKAENGTGVFVGISGTTVKVPVKHYGDYTFASDKSDDISCIAHIVNNYFFLGKGSTIYVCEKNNSKMTFDIVKNSTIITLPKSGTVLANWINQGMYCRTDKLYKIYSERVSQSEQIKRNYIAVYNLTGTRPYYTGASLSAVYSCNRDEKFLFEVQSIDVSTSGEIRIAIDKRDTGENDYKAGVYLVQLNN